MALHRTEPAIAVDQGEQASESTSMQANKSGVNIEPEAQRSNQASEEPESPPRSADSLVFAIQSSDIIMNQNNG
jgi:hypothetical protein